MSSIIFQPRNLILLYIIIIAHYFLFVNYFFY
nr:MAG TPA: hypothetical protein [Caudoviricetes sp.]